MRSAIAPREDHFGIADCPDVAHGGETRGEGERGVMRGIEPGLRVGILNGLQAELGSELRHQMDVAIDQTGKNELVAQIDEGGAGRRIDEAWRDGLDPLAFDQHALLPFGALARVGKQRAGMDDFGAGCHVCAPPAGCGVACRSAASLTSAAQLTETFFDSAVKSVFE